MKIKNSLTVLSFSIVEEKIEANIYQEIISNMNFVSKKNDEYEDEQENEEAQDEIMFPAIQKNQNTFYTVKVSKSLPNFSNFIQKYYAGKIIGPMTLKLSTNKDIFGLNLNKKENIETATWVIKIKNFFIEMPKENYSLWHYDKNKTKVVLHTEVLSGLYLLPIIQFANQSIEDFNLIYDSIYLNELK